MAALLLRRASSLIPKAARSHVFPPLSVLVTCSPGSSSLIPVTTSYRLFASLLPPFPTYSPSRVSSPKAESPFKVHADFPKTGYLSLKWESQEEIINITVEEEDRESDSEIDTKLLSLQMHIIILYVDKLSKRLEFDVALPGDLGQISIQNATMSVDDCIRDCFQVHSENFEGLFEKRGFNLAKFNFLVKCAEKLKENKKIFESNAESVHVERPDSRFLTVIWESEDEIIEIEVNEKMHDDHSEIDVEEHGLEMRFKYCCGMDFCNRMTFGMVIPDDQCRIAVQKASMSVDDYSRKLIPIHLDDFTGFLKKRGLNDSNLDFVVKYIEKMQDLKQKVVNTGIYNGLHLI